MANTILLNNSGQIEGVFDRVRSVRVDRFGGATLIWRPPRTSPEWRNWYTHQTQNLARFTPHESSSLSSGTTDSKVKVPGRHKERPSAFAAFGLSSVCRLALLK